MIKKNNILIIIISVLFCILLTPKLSYASNTKFLTPKLSIGTSGIKFDNSDVTENSFKNAGDEVKAINTILGEYRLLITFGSAVVSFTMIGIFIVNLMKLGNSRGNPQARSKAITGLIFTGIATALAGSVTVIAGLFYNFLG